MPRAQQRTHAKDCNDQRAKQEPEAPELSRARFPGLIHALIQLESLPPGFVCLPHRLTRLIEQEVFQYQVVDPGAHEANVRLLGCAYDRLTAHVERSIYQYRAPGQCLEAANQLMKARIVLPMHRLNPRRVIDVRDSRNRRTRDVQLVDAE